VRDPHVASLRYRVEDNPRVTFADQEGVQTQTDIFHVKLSDGLLVLEPKLHFASVEAARVESDLFVRSWEIDVFLKYGSKELTFIFDSAEVIDLDPPPPGSQVIGVGSGTVTINMSASGSDHQVRRHYPRPPEQFRDSPDVETLWNRYEGFKNGREPLLSMAYFCLTFILVKAGGRSQAAKQYKIDDAVLSRLGMLTSRKGDEKSARKVNKDSPLTPLSPEEAAWVEEMVKTIIRRVGESSSNTSGS
jgi:hypothetical protein